MTIRFHKGDLPDLDRYTGDVAIDTEAMGLQAHRDRLCVVQLSPGDGSADVVQIAPNQKQAPNIAALLKDQSKTKIFHFARFDVALLLHSFDVVTTPIFCTKIASKLTRTYTDKHSLKDLARELIGVDMSKQQQSSDWGSETLSDAQLNYAASDVLHLHSIRDILKERLTRENRHDIAKACFDFMPTRTKLDLAGWDDTDIFAHS